MAGPDRINRGIYWSRLVQGRAKVTRVVVANVPENAGRDLSVEQSILGPDIELVQAVARRARGFGTTIVAYDPYPDEDAAADLGVQFCDLPTLLAEADIISLNCGLSSDNQHLIDASAFRRMRRNPILINCARGGLVDEGALVDALDTGQLSGAALDVLNDESADLRTSKLTGRKNVIITPHVAFYSDASILEIRRASASNIRNFLDGEHAKVRKYVHSAAS